mgnify:CR=1 FL=1
MLGAGLCFFQAEDGIRDLVRSRGRGDVDKRQLVQTVLGLSPTKAGLMLMPAGLAMGLIYPFVGRLADRHSVGLMGAGGLTGCVVAVVALLSRIHI